MLAKEHDPVNQDTLALVSEAMKIRNGICVGRTSATRSAVKIHTCSCGR